MQTATLAPPLQAPTGADSAPESVARSCPRCGYDLTGVIRSWRDACPLNGTCSECGLELEWSRILSDLGRAPPWSFEHTERLSFAALLKTGLRAMRPRVLWSDLRIECPVVPYRLGILLVLALVGVHIAMAISVTAMEIAQHPLGLAVVIDNWLALVVQSLTLPYMVSGLARIPVFAVVAPAALAMVLMPATLLLLVESFKRARLRRIHIWRGFCYSCLGVIGVELLLGTGVSLLVWIGRYQGFALDEVNTLAQGELLVFPFWLLLWWRSFIRQYLKLPHSFAVAFLLWVVTLLATPVVEGVLILGGEWLLGLR